MAVHQPHSLIGRNALVTGASGGIGRAVALELARCGANLLLHYRRSAERVHGLQREIQALRGESITIQADLGTVDGQDRLAEEARAAADTFADSERGIDILVHCAGADILADAELADLPFDEKLAVLLATDAVATVRLSRRIGRMMQEHERGGAIVTIGWDGAERGMAGDSAELFSTAKGAVMAFSRSLAQSLAPKVRVNCVAPGWIQTAWGQGASEYWQKRARRESLMGRWGQPGDIARAIRFLVSDDAAFISGQVLDVNGGFRIAETDEAW